MLREAVRRKRRHLDLHLNLLEAYAPFIEEQELERLFTAYGWFNLIAGIMLLPASFLFGWLWQTFSAETAFSFSAACAALAAILLKWWVGAGSSQRRT